MQEVGQGWTPRLWAGAVQEGHTIYAGKPGQGDLAQWTRGVFSARNSKQEDVWHLPGLQTHHIQQPGEQGTRGEAALAAGPALGPHLVQLQRLDVFPRGTSPNCSSSMWGRGKVFLVFLPYFLGHSFGIWRFPG